MNVEKESKMQIIEHTIDMLMEHFDTVQILTTSHEPNSEDGTVRWNVGRGNWYARYGQMREWVIREDERTRCDIRKSEEEGS